MLVLRVVLCFSFVASLALSKELRADVAKVWGQLIAPYNDYCMTESKVNVDDATKVVTEAIVADTPEMGCYIKCLYDKLNMIGKDGQFNATVILDKCPYMSPKLTEQCIEISQLGKELSQKSYQLGNCIITYFAV